MLIWGDKALEETVFHSQARKQACSQGRHRQREQLWETEGTVQS